MYASNLAVTIAADSEPLVGALSRITFQMTFNRLSRLGKIALVRAAAEIAARKDADGMPSLDAIEFELYARFRAHDGDWRAVAVELLNEVWP